MGRNPQQNGFRFPSLPPKGGQESYRHIARGHADSYMYLDFFREGFALYERVTFFAGAEKK
ncbi:hypothetical protein JCM12178A_09670 [Salidesulfovibrio brasiliensis]